MNELQLHSRLSDLADDLAPGDDPFELVAGARALHRRRRRTRIGVAGAALAVALVAVGVPTAMNTLSAPDRGEVASPTSSADPDRLARAVVAVRAALTEPELGPVPDPADELPCPDGSGALSAAAGRSLAPSPTNAEVLAFTGCTWHDETPRSGAATNRLDVQLIADPDLTVDDVADWLAPGSQEEGCGASTLLDEPNVTALIFCDTDDGTTWDVLVFDGDGEGAWRLIAAAGPAVPDDVDRVARGLGILWDDLQTRPAGDVPISPLNRSFNEVVNGFDARSHDVFLKAPSTAMSCPDLPGRLTRTGVELSEVRAPGGSLTCTWSADAGPSAGLSYSVGFTAGEPPVFDSEQDVNLDFSDGGDDAQACFGVVLPGTDPAGGLAACQLTDREEWRLDVPDAGGDGTWVITLDLPGIARIDSADAVPALIDLADARW